MTERYLRMSAMADWIGFWNCERRKGRCGSGCQVSAFRIVAASFDRIWVKFLGRHPKLNALSMNRDSFHPKPETITRTTTFPHDSPEPALPNRTLRSPPSNFALSTSRLLRESGSWRSRVDVSA